MQRLPLLRRGCAGVCRQNAACGTRPAAMAQDPMWGLSARAASSSSPPSSSSSPSPSSSSSASPSSSTSTAPLRKGKRTHTIRTSDTTNGAVMVSFGQADTVNAYNEFAELVGCCDVNGLLEGSEQAYYSTALVMDSLLKPASDITEQLGDDSKERIQKGIIDSMARLALARWALPARIMQARTILSKEFSVELDPKDGAPTEDKVKNAHAATKAGHDAAASSTAAQEKEAVAPAEDPLPTLDELKAGEPGTEVERSVVAMMRRVLPMSTAMAEKMYDLWSDHRRGKADAMRLAAASDLVIESQLVAFLRFDNALLHYNPVLNCVRKMDVTLSDSVVDYWRTHALEETMTMPPEGGDAHGAAAAAAATTASTTKKEDETGASTSEATSAGTSTQAKVNHTGMSRLSQQPSPLPKSTNDAGVDNVVGEDSAEYAAGIRVDDINMNEVPANAKALVLVALDVVCPPQRFAKYYDYFYTRLIGCENEYQRMAVARLFALYTPHWLVRGFEMLLTPFTPRLEIGYTPYVGGKLGLPEDMSHSVPTARKLMCFYMDGSNRWVLSDIFNTGAVITKLPDMPEKV